MVSRSVLLFGGLGLWVLQGGILLNHRDDERVKSDAPAWSREINGLVISLVVFGVFVFLHTLIKYVAVR